MRRSGEQDEMRMQGQRNMMQFPLVYPQLKCVLGRKGNGRNKKEDCWGDEDEDEDLAGDFYINKKGRSG